MQQTSALYRELISDPNHKFEVALVIGESGRLITEWNELLLFAGTAILIASSSADSGFREEMLYSMRTSHSMFSGNTPEVGAVISGEIDVVMKKPTADIPRRAMLRPYIRVTNGTDTSEWIPQGTYYIDTKEITHNDNGLETLTIHGYDSIILLDANYPSDSSHDYPLLDTSMVQFIANSYDLSVDTRTWEIMTDGYMIPLPVGYSSREVLGMIASAYAGAFIMTPENQLRLVQINEMPTETRILIDHAGYQLVFGENEGEVKILV